MRKYRKFRPELWEKLLVKLDVKIDLGIANGFFLVGRRSSIIYTKHIMFLIDNAGIDGEHKVQKTFKDNFPIVLRGLRLENNPVPLSFKNNAVIIEMSSNELDACLRK